MSTLKRILCDLLVDARTLRDGSFGKSIDPVGQEHRELVGLMIDEIQEALLLVDQNMPIKITRIIETCSGCPSQWSGTTQNDDIFFARYRHGFLRVDVGEQTVYSEDFVSESGGDGILSFEELVHHIGHLFNFTGVKWVDTKEDLGPLGKWQ